MRTLIKLLFGNLTQAIIWLSYVLFALGYLVFYDAPPSRYACDRSLLKERYGYDCGLDPWQFAFILLIVVIILNLFIAVLKQRRNETKKVLK
jgi:hypothetical protein